MRTAWIRTSISRFSPSLICLSVSLIGSSSTIAALVDSGATLNLIHERVVQTLHLDSEPYAPTRILVADGRILAHSNRQVTLSFRVAGRIQKQTFLIAPIGVHSIIVRAGLLRSAEGVLGREVSLGTFPLPGQGS